YVDENVFAYSNRAGGERALVLYNNAYQRTRGRLRSSTAINVGSESQTHLVRRSLCEALDLQTDSDIYYVCRDHSRELEHIYSGRQLAEEGLHAELDGYQNMVLLDFREIHDIDGSWGTLARELDGRGVVSINAAYRDVILKPMRDSLHRALRPALLKALLTGGAETLSDVDVRHEFVQAMETFLEALEEQMIAPVEVETTLRDILRSVDAVHRTWEETPSLGVEQEVLMYLRETGKQMVASPEKTWALPALWAVLAPLGRAISQSELQVRTAAWMDEWPVTPVLFDVFRELGLDHDHATLSTELVKLMVRYSDLPLILTVSERGDLIERMFEDPVLNDFLFVNQYEGKLWFSKEQFEKLMYWLFFCSAVHVLGDRVGVEENAAETVHGQYHRVHEMLAAADSVKYQVEPFLEVLS
ncbi:MAG: hypothetical protein U9Q79_03095, partial [Candidatus Hydrogenedentes bacterium]|nr:hypothetical protein [Candidatus Hydrogenedentota bacterium]